MKTRISEKEIRNIIRVLLKKAKINPERHGDIIDKLVETSLRGVDSHGIRLLPHYIRATLKGRINFHPKFKFKRLTPSVIVLDADHTFGITASVLAMNKAIEVANKNGVGVVSVKNSSHFGAAGIYGLMAAKKNMIGIAMTNVEDLVVPYGGTKKFLGTNAFCFAAPMKDETPIILDMATTNISLNKLRMYQKENKKLEDERWAVDRSGRYTDNTNDFFALTHFGGYKGYGLALMIEILCSILTGGPYGPHITHMFPLNSNKRNLSHFFMAIDIKKFQPVGLFKKRMKEMVKSIRDQTPAPGFKNVMVAGDPEKEIYKERLMAGIPLTKEIIEDYNNLAQELGINDLL